MMKRAWPWRRLVPGLLVIINAAIIVSHRDLVLLAVGAYGYLPFINALGESYFVFLFGSPLLSFISGLAIIFNRTRKGGALLVISGIGMSIGWFGPVGFISGPILIVAGLIAHKAVPVSGASTA